MIPYFQLTTIHLGFIPIQVWGVLVALGFVIGAKASEWRLKKLGLEHKVIFDMLGWMILWAMIASRLTHVLLYEPAYYLQHPMAILRFWEGGLSIYGGLVAATVTGVVLLKRREFDLHRYADATIFGLPIGFAIGRIGCFLIHDHPGTATHFFLGIKYPDGVTRHDLGLYEAITSFLLFLLFLLMNKKRVQSGWYTIIFCFWYGTTRFLMDFLRTADVRYFGLTPAQYFSLALIFIGFGLVKRNHHNHLVE